MRRADLRKEAILAGMESGQENMQMVRVLLEYAAAEKDHGVRALLLRDLVMRYSAAEIRLKELNDLKDRFLGIAAHDLRSPLASIRGFSEVLLDEDAGPLTDEQREFLAVIYDASESMLMLVNDLLDISVIESGKLDLKLQSASLPDTVRERVHMLEILARNKGVSIGTQVVPETRPVRFDPLRIGQVVDNLVGNAIKFSPPGSRVQVSVLNENHGVTVGVRDQGPGIPHEEQSKLFTAFQKLSAKPTGGEKSTGLGLSIAKKIMDAHNGSIGVESTPGAGAVFFFSLPYASDETPTE